MQLIVSLFLPSIQIALRAAILEQENNILRIQLSALRKELATLQQIVCSRPNVWFNGPSIIAWSFTGKFVLVLKQWKGWRQCSASLLGYHAQHIFISECHLTSGFAAFCRCWYTQKITKRRWLFYHVHFITHIRISQRATKIRITKSGSAGILPMQKQTLSLSCKKSCKWGNQITFIIDKLFNINLTL